MNLLRISPIVLFLALASLFPERSLAVLVVDWGGNYVTDAESMQSGGFSGGQPLILSPSTGYSGTSSKFYGAVAITGSRTRQTLVQNASPTDRLQLKFSDTNTGTGAGLVLWDQKDFLGGMSSGNVGFTSSDTITLELATYAQFEPGRLVIQQDSNYYVSEAIFNSTSSPFTVNPTSLQWFNYDPTGWSATNSATLSTIGSVATPVSGGELVNITEIGFLFYSKDASANAVRISNFEVNMSAVPEPSSAALLVAGLALVTRVRKRGRTSKSTPI